MDLVTARETAGFSLAALYSTVNPLHTLKRTLKCCIGASVCLHYRSTE